MARSKQRSNWLMLVDRVNAKLRFLWPAYSSYKDAKKRTKSLHGGYKGTAEEYRNVKTYWSHYHKHPKMMWFRMYSDGKEKLDPRYIPLSMWYTTVLPYFNNTTMGRAYVDKCAYDVIYKDLKMPEIIVKNVAGRFYGPDQKLITKEEAVEKCMAQESFIAKCATGSYGGHGIVVLIGDEINRESVEQTFEQLEKNYVVQKLVKQHEDLKKINPSSLNTLRVMSFFFRDEVHILSAQLRMGSGDARVDNYSSGGFACNVQPDGRLSERAVSRDGWATVHPNGMAFKDIVVPAYDRVVEIIKEEHKKIPYMNIIGWDFGIDEEGDPVFIEMNEGPQDNQNGSGPTFGDMTEEVLEEVFITKSNRNAFFESK